MSSLSAGAYARRLAGNQWCTMRKGAILLCIVLGSLLPLFGCGFKFSACPLTTGCACPASTACPPLPIQPSISAISPTSTLAGSAGFKLTITGGGLQSNSQVNFGSAALTPGSVTPGNCAGAGKCEVLTVSVPAQDVATASTITVSVANGSLVSNAVAFAVTPQSGSVTGVPQLLLLSPLLAPAGGTTPVDLVIEAENVAQGARVNFGSLSLAPTSTSVTFYPGAPALTTLQVQVPVSALATAQEVAVTVANPGASGGVSNAGNFFVVNKGSFPIEESVSNATPPVPSNAPSTHSSAATDGFLVAFDSTATNVVPDATTGLSQVYLRRNCLAPAPNCTSQTTLVSVAPDGSPGAGGVRGSDKPVISPDGRFIVFESDDTNLVPGVTQAVEQIYLRDTCQGFLTPLAPSQNCTPKTILVSASPTGAPGNAPSTNPSLGAFGLFVAFQSAATNLVRESVPSGVQQVYLYRGCNALPVLNPVAGCQPSTVLLSVDASGNAGDKDSANPALDLGGLVVAFQSLADNIVANTPGNGFQQIYLHTTCLALASPAAGGLCKNTAQAASLDASGKLGTGDSVTPAVGLFGSLTAFATRAPNLLPANTSSEQIFLANTCFDVPPIPCSAQKGSVISVDQNGLPGQGDSFNPAFNGIHVAFTSQASLISGVTGQQVYATGVCPLLTGVSCPTTGPVLASADSSGAPIGGDHAAIDLTNQFVTFSSTGPNSSSGPTEIFLAAPFF